MRRRWWLVVAVLVLTAMVAPARVTGGEASAAVWDDPVEAPTPVEDPVLGVEDPQPPLPGTAADEDPSPEPIVRGDPDEERVAVAAESLRLELPVGDHRATPVLGGRAPVGDLPIAVVTDREAFGRAPVPQVRVLVDATQPERMPGALSPLFDVGFVDAQDRVVQAEKPPTLEVDVSWMPGGLYGNLRNRLVIKWFEGCRTVPVADEDDPKEVAAQATCDRVVSLPTERDVEAGTISTVLDPELIREPVGKAPQAELVSLMGAGAGSSSGYGLGSVYETDQGSWGATPLTNQASYQVGVFSGTFDTSYPIPVPPAAAGAAPSVALGYSSGSVDGIASDTNAQASPVGLGWSLAAGGSITRHYKTGCDPSTAPGELCPLGHEYTLSLNGVGSRLVLDDEVTSPNYVATFRLESDPMWRVELFNEDSAVTFNNKDSHDEYWVVTTPDGTRYEFGKSADSVDYAPVYTYQQSQSEFSCEGLYDEDHDDTWREGGTGAVLNYTCQKAWRWNLSKVIDTSGNEILFSYLLETNWYGLRNGNDEAEYVSASHLREILYTDGGSLTPRAKVVFHTELRCEDPLSDTDCEDVNFVDVPEDLVCRRSETCAVYDGDNIAPSFFSERRLDAIETQVKMGSDWDTVQWWTLDHAFPDGTDEQLDLVDSEPKLWLDQIVNRPDLSPDDGDEGRVAYVQIEAEDWDSQSGVENDSVSDFGTGEYVNKATNGDYLVFHDIDFGDGADAVLVRFARKNAGGNIKFRVGSATTPEFASFSPSSTGGWQKYETESVSISSSPTGVEDLYVTFDRGTTGEVAHLNWFRFIPEEDTLTGLPPMDYGLEHLPNRAENISAININGRSPMRMPRINQIDLPLGGQVNVTYDTPNGWDSDSSTGPCHQDYVNQEGNVRLPCDFHAAIYDSAVIHFAKYKVVEVETIDPDTENQRTWTRYDYSRPAWRYSDIPGHNSYESDSSCSLPCNLWTDFRGHEWVKVTMHDNGGNDYATTEHRFYQGTNKDYVIDDEDWTYSASIDILNPTNGTVADTETDESWLVGRSSQVITYDGSYSNVLSNTETGYDWYTTTPAQGQHRGRFVYADIVEMDTYGTATLTTKTTYKYDKTATNKYGRLLEEVSHGDTSVTGDERLIKHEYTTANETDWIVHAVKRQQVFDGETDSGTKLARTKFFYDTENYGAVGSQGRLRKTETELNATENAVTKYTYDTYGRVDTVTDANEKHLVKTEYDATYGHVDKVTNAGAAIGGGDDQVTEIVDYDPGFGVALEIEDPNDNTTAAEYDEYGRLVKVWLPTEDSQNEPAIKYAYTVDPSDYPAHVKTSQLTNDTGSGTYLDSWTFYDGFGDPIQTHTPSANGGEHWIITSGFTGKQGLPKRQSAPFERVLTAAPQGGVPDYFDADWIVVGENQPEVPLQTYSTYDAFGRLTDTETFADDTAPNALWSTSVDYDVVTYETSLQGLEELQGLEGTVTDEVGDIVDRITDPYGNLVRVIEHDGSNLITTEYDYDAAGKLTDVTDTDGETTTVVYDVGGRKTSLEDPDMGTWWYEYDIYGNLTKQTDARTSSVLAFDYDDFDRLIGRYKTSTSGYQLAEWVYDATGELGLVDKSIAYEDPDGNGTTDYQVTVDPQGYDARGRVTSSKWTIHGETYTVDWTYDEADRVKTIKYPTVDGSRETVTYGYDDDNRGLASGLTSNRLGSSIVSSATWNDTGAPLTQIWGNDTDAFTRTWGYEPDTQRLDSILAGDNSPDYDDILELVYQYEYDGNVKWVVDHTNSSQRQCFEYDDLDRLTVAYTKSAWCTGIGNWESTVGDGAYRRQYDYHDNGNLHKVSDDGGSTWDTYTYANTGNAGPHAVTTFDSWTYTYDKIGNLNTRTKGSPATHTETAEFDINNRLANYEVDYPNDTNDVDTTFVYDADGNRVMRIENWVDQGVTDTETHYVAGLFEVTNPGTTPDESRTYYTFGNLTVGYRYWTSTLDERRFLVSDHLGSNAVEVNESTGAATEQLYLPFGALRASSSNGLGTDRTYTGQTSDKSTGLMHYQARYYLPQLRRFISADTIVPNPGNPQHLNRYTYVTNNPTRYVDPSGHVLIEGLVGGRDVGRHSAPLCKPGRANCGPGRYKIVDGEPVLEISYVGLSQAEVRDLALDALAELGQGYVETYGEIIAQSVERVKGGQYVWRNGRWVFESNPNVFRWRIDVTGLAADVQEEMTERFAWKMAKTIGKGSFFLEVIVDGKGIVDATLENGAEGFVYEVGKKGTGWVAGAAAGFGYAKFLCPRLPGGTAACAVGTVTAGVVTGLVAESAYVAIWPNPFEE